MTKLRSRFILAALTVGTAACAAADSTAPASRLAVRAPTHDDVMGDSVPNASCRSGYALINGRCTGE